MNFFINIIDALGSMFNTAWLAVPAVTRTAFLVAIKGVFALVMKWQLLVLIPVITTVWIVVQKPEVQSKLVTIEGFVSGQLGSIQCLANKCGADIFSPRDFFKCVDQNSSC